MSHDYIYIIFMEPYWSVLILKQARQFVLSHCQINLNVAKTTTALNMKFWSPRYILIIEKYIEQK